MEKEAWGVGMGGMEHISAWSRGSHCKRLCVAGQPDKPTPQGGWQGRETGEPSLDDIAKSLN